jgi:O-antigen ligase
MQLVPLPPWIWTRLPNREWMTGVFDLIGGARPWMPISVSPNSTWLSVLSLIPPFAIFAATIQLNYRQRRMLSLIILGVGIVSVFLSLTQFAQGPSSSLRFFAITNDAEPVGFFANKNHFAAILYALLLFAAAWAIDAAFKTGSWADRRSFEAVTVIALTVSFLLLAVLLMTEALARSRAGLGLTIVALVGIFAMAFMDRRNSSERTPTKLLLGAAIVSITLFAQFLLYQVLNRFTLDTLQDARVRFARNTIAAAWAYFPFGSGVGSFVPVYGMFEKPADIIEHTYANHAHNDVLEMWLESGVVGIAIAVFFVIWLVARSRAIWSRTAAGVQDIDRSLARAATIVIGLLIAHSFVDYPLRTGAMMAVFAFSCALLIEPLRPAEPEVSVAQRSHLVEPPRHRNVPARIASSPSSRRHPVSDLGHVPEVPSGPMQQTGGRWGDDISWPEEWRNEKGSKSADESGSEDEGGSRTGG